MKLGRLVTSWENAIRIIIMQCIVLCLLSGTLGVMALKVYRHRERVVIVPPLAMTTSDRLEVAWRNANQDYYKSFALYIATLVGNITPENITFVADSIGNYLTPEIHSEIRTKMLALAKDEVWTTSSQASYFAPRQIVYEEQTERVFVIGDVVTTGYGTLGERKSVIYEMIVQITEGVPKIHYFTSYEGNQPRTLKWLLSQQESEKAKYQWLLDKAKRLSAGGSQ